MKKPFIVLRGNRYFAAAVFVCLGVAAALLIVDPEETVSVFADARYNGGSLFDLVRRMAL